MTSGFSQLIERVSALAIGTVESVSPSEIQVLLDLEAPQTTALNTGTPTGFPRINSYVLIPNEIGAVVGVVVWVGIQRSSFPKRRGLKDFDVIDLPFPLRVLTVMPVGTLTADVAEGDREGTIGMRLDRGVTTFPTVGDPVHLPTANQLLHIIESSGKAKRLCLGTSPLAEGRRVSVDPDRLFGRHLAVLGNTGSGKSCTVAGLIRWSLEAAREEGGAPANARFIVLDPNGEYTKAFSDLEPPPRVFRVGPPETCGRLNIQSLRVPAWMWNGHEWSAFAAAKHGTQRPLLMRALRDLRSNLEGPDPDHIVHKLARIAYDRCFQFRTFLSKGYSFFGEFPGSKTVGQNYETLVQEIERFRERKTELPEEVVATLKRLYQNTKELIKNRKEQKGFWSAFGPEELQDTVDTLLELASLAPHPESASAYTEDSPIPFDVEKLADYVEFLAAVEGGSMVQWVGSMLTRIRTMLSDERLLPIIEHSGDVTLMGWLETYIGFSEAKNGEVAIIDLSLVPSDIIRIVIAVVARVIFEAAQRYVRHHEEGKSLPTVLVLEEAHTFIGRHTSGDDDTTTSDQVCRHTFERIAREGRKFGLGLVLSSQRPSELSQTVLAQCNSFILHRIVNDDDQQLVRRLVPDALGGLMRELPNLPSRRAVLLGWATPIPVLTDVHHLCEAHRPRSDDPDFWDVWTRRTTRGVSWKPIVDEWTLS